MPRATKEHKVLNCKIDKEVSDMLEAFSEKTGISKTAAVEKALKKYIEDYNKTGKLQ
jgi:hypothetical protein